MVCSFIKRVDRNIPFSDRERDGKEEYDPIRRCCWLRCRSWNWKECACNSDSNSNVASISMVIHLISDILKSSSVEIQATWGVPKIATSYTFSSCTRWTIKDYFVKDLLSVVEMTEYYFSSNWTIISANLRQISSPSSVPSTCGLMASLTSIFSLNFLALFGIPNSKSYLKSHTIKCLSWSRVEAITFETSKGKALMFLVANSQILTWIFNSGHLTENHENEGYQVLQATVMWICPIAIVLFLLELGWLFSSSRQLASSNTMMISWINWLLLPCVLPLAGSHGLPLWCHN